MENNSKANKSKNRSEINPKTNPKQIQEQIQNKSKIKVQKLDVDFQLETQKPHFDD